MAKKKDAPVILFRRDGGRLAPSSAFDAEALDELPYGVDIEVSFSFRRSSPQHRLYWKMLGEVVKATDKFPNSKKLHNDLKLALGYHVKIINAFTGAIHYEADSTAFEAMEGPEFKVFFDRAVRLIATDLGIDALSFYTEQLERLAA